MPATSSAPASLSSPAGDNDPATPEPRAAAGPGQAPDGVAYPKAIRSFVRRAGRTTAGQSRALQELGPGFVIPYQPSLDVLAAMYPQLAPTQATSCARAENHRPLVLEIGFGMGEASAHIAALLPGTDFLCCEVHEPGIGALLKRIGVQDLQNIRILAHDAVEVVDRMLPVWDATQPERGLDGIHVFFPDPWHKKRHNKRRLLQAPLVRRLAERLRPGAYLHCATDWQPYAEQMLQVLSSEPLLDNPASKTHPELGGYSPKPFYRPLTKFENRGVKLGHGVWDLVFRRKAP